MSYDAERPHPRAAHNASRRIRILVVDDQPIVREALQLWLGADPNMEVVGSAESADQAIDKILEMRPDVVIMDIEMPGMSCFDAVRRMQARETETRFMFLSAHVNAHFVEQALAVGARGIVSKQDASQHLLDAIRIVAEGGSWYSEAALTASFTEASAPRHKADGTAASPHLTPREYDVIRYIAQGMSNKEIAEVMSVSPKTVENHCTNLMRKLNLSDRVDVARYAFREGLAVP